MIVPDGRQQDHRAMRKKENKFGRTGEVYIHTKGLAGARSSRARVPVDDRGG
jgi:hypothetical protein